MSLIFYDTETTGKRKFFDQILQFSAIRTDFEFEELDRIDRRCRLLPYIVPSPEALRVNRVTAAQLTDPLLPSHYEMIRAIRSKLVSWSPALFIGYNSIDFDEKFLRQALYQTVHDPYLTSGNRNCRADALRLARAVHACCPGALEVPPYPDGRPCFRLQELAPANGFKGDKAHDASFDASATIFICKIISEQAPSFWSNFLKFTQKASVEGFTRDEAIFCVSDYFRGTTRTTLVTCIGASLTRNTELLIIDLSVDPERISALSDEEMQGLFKEPNSGVRALKINECPILFERSDLPAHLEPSVPGDAEAGRRAVRIREDETLRNRLRQAYESARFVFPQSPYVERQLYDSFPNDSIREQLETFHDTPWERRFALLDDFIDRRFAQLGRRLIFVERPDLLGPSLRQSMTHMLSKRVLDGDDQGSWLSLKVALSELETILSSAPEADIAFLQAHHAALKVQIEQANQSLQ